MTAGIPLSTLPQDDGVDAVLGTVTRADGVAEAALLPTETLVDRTRQALLPEIDGAASGVIQAISWATLAATPGTRVGQPGLVTEADGGTHTDPVVGGGVKNYGRYAWSASPAGWRRVGELPLSWLWGGDLGGTDAAMTATVAGFVNVDGSTIIVRKVGAPNASAATLSINGGPPRAVLDAAGYAVVQGALGVNVQTALTLSGSAFRILALPAAGMRTFRGIAPSLSGLTLSVTIPDGSPVAWQTIMSIILPATVPAGGSLSVNGQAAVPIYDRTGRPIRGDVLTAGATHLFYLGATAAYVLGGGGEAVHDQVRTAQALCRDRSIGRFALAEAGLERDPIVLVGNAYAFWTASTGDRDRVLQLYGARRIDLRHLPVTAGSALTLWVAPNSTAKLITDNKVYTATGGVSGQVVHVFHPEASTWAWSGAVTQESDALQPPAACDASFITGGQSIARRWLGGAGMHGFQRRLAELITAPPSLWAINGAQGGSGLTAASNATNFWWNAATAQPGPAALAWKAALDGRPSTQPAPSWVYWAFGQTDAAMFGTHADLQLASYKTIYKALFSWMRSQIGNAGCPIILSPVGGWDQAQIPTNAMAQAIRSTEMALAAEDPSIVLGPQYFDLDRPSDDVHLTSQGQIIQGYRLGSFVAEKIYGKSPVYGPYVETISEAFGGRRYRLLIRSAYGLDYDPLQTDMMAVFAAGTDVFSGTPLPIARCDWTAINSASWYLDIWLASASSGATVVFPYGALREARAGRYPRASSPGPAGAYGNYWPLAPFTRAAG